MIQGLDHSSDRGPLISDGRVVEIGADDQRAVVRTLIEQTVRILSHFWWENHPLFTPEGWDKGECFRC